MTLLYAKVGGPPAHWASLTIKKDGMVCSGGQYVVEVDVLGCWAVLEELWQGNVIQTKVYGNWTIEEPPDDKTAADCKAKYPDNVRFPNPTVVDDPVQPAYSRIPGRPATCAKIVVGPAAAPKQGIVIPGPLPPLPPLPIINDQNDPGDSDPPGDYYYNDPSNI